MLSTSFSKVSSSDWGTLPKNERTKLTQVGTDQEANRGTELALGQAQQQMGNYESTYRIVYSLTK